MKLTLPRIYPITDTRISGISHARQVERLVAGGASLVQLRDKHAAPRDFYESAAEALKIAGAKGVKIIINDRVDIALALGADGVHLGQDDMPPGEARAILGDHAIIGFSTHSLKQAAAATHLPIDYIGVGPIFETRTKAEPDALVGLDGLREIRKATGDIPIVAIGGIGPEQLRSVFAAGADAVAMIGAIVSDNQNIEKTIRQLINQW